MEFLPSKKILHTDGLSRLIPKIREPLEGSLSSEVDIKNILYNTVKELPVTLEKIRFKGKFDKFITEKKNEIMDPKKNKSNNIFLYVTVYSYMEIGWW